MNGMGVSSITAWLATPNDKVRPGTPAVPGPNLFSGMLSAQLKDVGNFMIGNEPLNPISNQNTGQNLLAGHDFSWEKANIELKSPADPHDQKKPGNELPRPDRPEDAASTCEPVRGDAGRGEKPGRNQERYADRERPYNDNKNNDMSRDTGRENGCPCVPHEKPAATETNRPVNQTNQSEKGHWNDATQKTVVDNQPTQTGDSNGNTTLDAKTLEGLMSVLANLSGMANGIGSVNLPGVSGEDLMSQIKGLQIPENLKKALMDIAQSLKNTIDNSGGVGLDMKTAIGNALQSLDPAMKSELSKMVEQLQTLADNNGIQFPDGQKILDELKTALKPQTPANTQIAQTSGDQSKLIDNKGGEALKISNANVAGDNDLDFANAVKSGLESHGGKDVPGQITAHNVSAARQAGASDASVSPVAVSLIPGQQEGGAKAGMNLNANQQNVAVISGGKAGQGETGGVAGGGASQNQATGTVFSTVLGETAKISHPAPESAPNGKIQPNQIIDRIVETAKVRYSHGKTDMLLRLDPPDLGAVNMKITSHAGTLRGHILVENSLVKDTIESNIHTLKESLQNQGIKVESLSVQVDTNPGRGNFAAMGDGKGNQHGQAGTERTDEGSGQDKDFSRPGDLAQPVQTVNRMRHDKILDVVA